jgi:hypothetical protein
MSCPAPYWGAAEPIIEAPLEVLIVAVTPTAEVVTHVHIAITAGAHFRSNRCTRDKRNLVAT